LAGLIIIIPAPTAWTSHGRDLAPILDFDKFEKIKIKNNKNKIYHSLPATLHMTSLIIHSFDNQLQRPF
jgi:hypothetical protein